jgi:hypothetical protein
VDPASASASTKRPQSWNRYSYSLNNPTNVVDPDGQVPVPLVIGLAVVGGILFGPDPANTPTSPDDPGVASSQGLNAVGATIGSVGVIALVKQFFSGGKVGSQLAEKAEDQQQNNGQAGGQSGSELSPQAEKAIQSLEKRIAEHEQKLADFKAKPTPRPGTEGLSQEIQNKSIEGRVKHLEHEIQTFKDNIAKIRQGKLRT